MTAAAMTRTFVREVVLPREPAPGETLADDVRDELRAAARAATLFAPLAPVEFGGAALPLSAWSAVLQEAGYSPIGPAVLNVMAPDEGNMHLLNLLATPVQRERFLAPLARGDVRSAFAMTEPHPGAGSDPRALSTTATRASGGWRITGRKRFISGALSAAFAIVMARTPEVGADSASLFLVPFSAEGVRVGPDIATIEAAIGGGHPHVAFRDCFVPDENMLGAAGAGFRHAQLRLAPARLTHCMRWLGLARRAHDTALDRAEHRSLFGSGLRDLGLAQALLADNVIDIETSAAVIDRAVTALEADPRTGEALSSVAKVHVSEAVFRVIDRSVQICGGDGVTHNLPLIQFLNEVRPFRVYDGSSETHRWAIARRAVKARAAEVDAGAQALDGVWEPSV